MDLIYQAVSNLDVLWLISAALVILILDVFILGTTALLLVSGTLFVLSVIKYFIDNPVIVTWSIPTVLVALFLMQRFFINISVSQKLPNQEKRQGTFKAVVRLAQDPGSSADYFYGYKDEKQAVANDSINENRRFKAQLEDGRTYMLPADEKLFEGQHVKVSISTDETARIVKYYE